MKNRIQRLFETKSGLLSVYFTAGYPSLGDTMPTLEALEAAGCDFVEIGMPFSDPLADGPVIQRSSLDAIENGMTIKTLFAQIAHMRDKISMPVILMGYINPVMHYGIRAFVDKCREVGVDGVILPDLPLDEFAREYKTMFDEAGLLFIPLIAPQLSDERIRHIDSIAEGFIYMVASAGITGNIKTSEDYRTAYFDRVARLGLRNKRMIGFGIKDAQGFRHACSHADGAIIGTAFIKHIKEHGTSRESIAQFIGSIRQ